MPLRWLTLPGREDLIGLDIGTDYVAASRVSVGRKNVRLTHGAYERFQPDASAQELATLIRKLWRRAGFPSFTVCSGLRSHALTLKYFRYPDMAEDELVAALRLEAEEGLQLSQDEIAFDWHASRSRKDGEKTFVEGVLAAVPLEELTNHVELLQSAGLFPMVVDVGCMAAGNLYRQLRRNELGAVCLVNAMPGSADISVLSPPQRIYPRTLFYRSSDGDGAADYLATGVAEALKYHQYKLRRDPARRVVVTGRLPARETLNRAIAQRCGLEPELWHPLEDITGGARFVRGLAPESREDALMTVALGLALRNG